MVVILISVFAGAGSAGCAVDYLRIPCGDSKGGSKEGYSNDKNREAGTAGWGGESQDEQHYNGMNISYRCPSRLLTRASIPRHLYDGDT